jgi:hypothetical protein
MQKFIPFKILEQYKLNYGDTVTFSFKDKRKQSIAFRSKDKNNYAYQSEILNTIQVEQMIFDYFVEHE